MQQLKTKSFSAIRDRVTALHSSLVDTTREPQTLPGFAPLCNSRDQKELLALQDRAHAQRWMHVEPVQEENASLVPTSEQCAIALVGPGVLLEVLIPRTQMSCGQLRSMYAGGTQCGNCRRALLGQLSRNHWLARLFICCRRSMAIQLKCFGVSCSTIRLPSWCCPLIMLVHSTCLSNSVLQLLGRARLAYQCLSTHWCSTEATLGGFLYTRHDEYSISLSVLLESDVAEVIAELNIRCAVHVFQELTPERSTLSGAGS